MVFYTKYMTFQVFDTKLQFVLLLFLSVDIDVP